MIDDLLTLSYLVPRLRASVYKVNDHFQFLFVFPVPRVVRVLGHRMEVQEDQESVVLKNWRVTQERVEKYLSDIYFVDVNLKGR